MARKKKEKPVETEQHVIGKQESMEVFHTEPSITTRSSVPENYLEQLDLLKNNLNSKSIPKPILEERLSELRRTKI